MTATVPSSPRSAMTHEEFAAQSLREAIRARAARIHDLADVVNERADEIARVGAGHGSYADIARRVQHDVLLGLLNLTIETLTKYAYDADKGRLTASPWLGGTTSVNEAPGVATTHPAGSSLAAVERQSTTSHDPHTDASVGDGGASVSGHPGSRPGGGEAEPAFRAPGAGSASCPYTHAHTRQFCGHADCRES